MKLQKRFPESETLQRLYQQMVSTCSKFVACFNLHRIPSVLASRASERGGERDARVGIGRGHVLEYPNGVDTLQVNEKVPVVDKNALLALMSAEADVLAEELGVSNAS